MDENNQPDGVQVPSDATVNEVTPSHQDGAAPTNDGGNAEQGVVNTAPRQGTAGDAGDEYRNIERERGKISQLQRELNQAKESEVRYQNLVSWIQRDKDRYKAALVETGGLTPEMADQEAARLFGGDQVKQGTNQVQPYPAYNPRDLVQQMRVEEALDDFDQTHPEISSDEREDVLLLAQSAMRRGLRPQEAFSEAERKVLGLESAKAEGLLEGQAKILAASPIRKAGAIGKMPSSGLVTGYTPTEEDLNLKSTLNMDEDSWKTYLKKQEAANQ